MTVEPCAVENCSNPTMAGGMCGMHYQMRFIPPERKVIAFGDFSSYYIRHYGTSQP